MYTSLHNHTDYSNAFLRFTDSINKVDKLIQYAYDIGLNGVAITDHEGISSYVQAEKYYKEMNLERPFKLILGNELYLIDKEKDLENRKKTAKHNFNHFILLAKNLKGNKQIRMLSSRANERGYEFNHLRRRPTYFEDLEEIIGADKGNVIGSTACIGGELPRLILKWKNCIPDEEIALKRQINSYITHCINIFGADNFYFELQPCLIDNEEQILVNKTLLMLGKVYKIKCIVTTDSHYLKKEDSEVHKVFLNSKDGGDSRETSKFYATSYMFTPEELLENLLQYFDENTVAELFKNTNHVNEQIESYSLSNHSDIPSLPIEKLGDFKIKHLFQEYYNRYKNLEYYANNERLLSKYFLHRIENGFETILNYKNMDNDTLHKYLTKVDMECGEIKALSEILESNMEDYFTTMQKVVDIMWDEGNSLVGVSRGSAMAFCLNYILGITQIDPLPFGDLFPSWRFLSVGRGHSLPDVDTDCESSKKEKIITAIKDYFGKDNVLQCITFGKLTTKTAIIKAGKGLGIDDKNINYITSLIPMERGSLYSLEDCVYGNIKKGRKADEKFIEEINKFDNLLHIALQLQGVIVQMGIHAGALNIMNNKYYETTAKMIAPNGNSISAFDLHDEEYTGTVKFDLLSIDALQKIRTTMDLLIKYKQIEEKDTLRETYNSILHPSNLIYDNNDLWKLLPKVFSCFQWDSPVGAMGLDKIKPKNIMELTAGNSLIRLQGSNGISPLDVYVKYKNDINNWFQDMSDYGLNEEEQEILKEYLLNSSGVMENQESCMRISMDKRISCFTLSEADKLRKTIAKADKKALKETEENFYNKGLKNGCRQVFLDYIWKVQIHYSLSYSFSVVHSYAYSVIALQELNLNYRYNPIFWNCACLITESGSDINVDREINVDYSKMANAISQMQNLGIKVKPPDANTSEYGFTIDLVNNNIIYGLKAITGINDIIVDTIISNRPYTSFEQFYNFQKENKTKITKSKILTLIKSGLFDEFGSRTEIMKKFINFEIKTRENLNLTHIEKLCIIDNGITDIARPYRFYKYITQKKFFYKQDKDVKSKKHYKLDKKSLEYFENLDFVEGKDYYVNDGDVIIVDKHIEKGLKKEFDKIKEEINQPSVIRSYNEYLVKEEFHNLVNTENEQSWVFDSLCFYDKQHPLSNYLFADFNNLPSEPKFNLIDTGRYTYKIFDLTRIAGTVIEMQHSKHYIKILTVNGVVTVKFQKQIYTSIKQNELLSRGNNLAISGYRRDDIFMAKIQKQSECDIVERIRV